MNRSYDSLKAMRAANKEQAEKFLNDNDGAGAYARGLPIMEAFQDWMHQELRRCPPDELGYAAGELIAVMLANTAANLANGRDEKPFVALMLATVAHCCAAHSGDRIVVDLNDVKP